MYCRASATDWIRSSCLMMVMAAASTPGEDGVENRAVDDAQPSYCAANDARPPKDGGLRGRPRLESIPGSGQVVVHMPAVDAQAARQRMGCNQRPAPRLRAGPVGRLAIFLGQTAYP